MLAQTDADSDELSVSCCRVQRHHGKGCRHRRPISARQRQRRSGRGARWRYQDANNYYIVRANALEGNVVLYKVENGKRTDLPVKGSGRTYGKKADVPKNRGARWA